jgi:hypothetical protein
MLIGYVNHPVTKGASEMAEKTIHELIAEQVASVHPLIAGEVAERFAKREVEKRATTLVQGLDKLSELKKNFEKLRPDHVTYNEKGEKVSEGYTKAKLEERNKAAAAISKLEKTITKAYDAGDFGELNQILGSGKGNKPEGGAEDKGTDAGDAAAKST